MAVLAPFAFVSNRLLDRLSRDDRARVLDSCEKEDLEFSQILAQPGDTMEFAYFPTGSFISLLVPMGGQSAVEVSLAGNEGFYGVPLALGIAISPVTALVQGSGTAWRISAARLRREMARLPSLRDCVDRYIHVVMSQVIQSAGCTRYHRIEQRLARWLLMTADRAHSSVVPITHEFLSYMLGVRRVGVTEAALALQARNLISYKRGIVTILDRRGLERAACACYRLDIANYKLALP